MVPDFLTIGHVAKDLSPEGFSLGGAATYASLTALRMGLRPAVLTSAAQDLDLNAAMPGVQVHVVPSSETTTFRNIYLGGRRTQFLTGVAEPVGVSDVPSAWLSAPLVLLGPLAGEVRYDSRAFPQATVIASLQGWLRRWDRDGRVSPKDWEGSDVLPYVDAAVVSADDIEGPQAIDRWIRMVPALIVTKGPEGASLHFDGAWHQIDAYPAPEVDPTGAGDVFAAAYLIRYRETTDPLESARFASRAASFSVEADGVDGIPTRAQVEGRLRSDLY